MYSRVTSFEIDTVRISVDGALRRYQEMIIPALREQEGYRGVLGLVTPDGKGLVISFWDTEEEATGERAPGFYGEVIEQFTTSFAAQPGRDHYEVVLADMPALAIDGG